ncbi:sensor histidine kinase [Streptomyces sp. NPDC058739]|uniref:sensor histidine kinase n=1 Tax=Streptomyces sp. NPDC058739 TaxID=3346618 RepID=UPI003689AAB8
MERSLHDGAQQSFVNLGLQLHLFRRRLSGTTAHDPELAALLDKALATLDRGHAELRVAARGIHPAVLGEVGLAAALRSLAADLPLPVDIRAAVPPGLPPAVELTVYYVVKEALSNVLKHADAETVRVGLRYCDGVLRLTVTDDGVGGADPAAGGTGLLGLRHRVSAYDGELTLHSRPGEGTEVSVMLPVAEEAAASEGGAPA